MMDYNSVSLDDVLDYVQPTKYLVDSTDYDDEYATPVLTAGKSFLLGYTDEKQGIFNEPPVIIFDDFTTSFHYVDFSFKVKSSALKILKPKHDQVNIKYVYYAMQLINFQPEQHKRYWISKYSKFKIPLPPIAVQERIAEILDAADALRQKDEQLLAKYEQLSQSIFLDMFGDPVSNPKGWETKKITELVSDEKYSLKRGPFGGALKKEIFVEEGYLVYEQYHALNNNFDFARYFIDEKKYQELKGFSVKPRDIIISCSGVYLGKLAIIPDGAKDGIINQALLKISLDNQKMTNHFFKYHFSQSNFRDKFFGANRGAGIPNFPPMKDFKTFPFIVPPIGKQMEFENANAKIMLQIDKVKDTLQKSESLFQSLLQKAFKGELVNE